MIILAFLVFEVFSVFFLAMEQKRLYVMMAEFAVSVRSQPVFQVEANFWR